MSSTRHVVVTRAAAGPSGTAGPAGPHRDGAEIIVSRRNALAALVAGTAAYQSFGATPAACADEGKAGIEILDESPPIGSKPIRQGSIALVHYVGYTSGGDIFDSTRGGTKYVDGGAGVNRPVPILMTPSPAPGIVEGLKLGLMGLSPGGKRTFLVPPSLGFGDEAVLAPFHAVPAGETLRYEVEVLRVSNEGPDVLVKGIAFCGKGGAGEQADGCGDIEPML
mmetsp:Transcript_45675/g.145483  ORF Transcript_45675/g.145483 Transcript_45675/m.145483 type:complete len:223 (+) Transcript_45675:366-1034(+)